MNDIRRQHPEHPEHPEQHPEQHPEPEQAHTVFDEPAEPAPGSVASDAAVPEPVRADRDPIHRTLRTIKWVVVAILVLAVVAGLYFVGSRLLERRGGPSEAPAPSPTGVGQTDYPSPSGGSPDVARSVSCLAETGPDATTTSRTFADVPGTECTHRTGSAPETLVLSGKLTARNTEGTGVSVTLNVNGKDCNGGEALSYARTYTPLYSNCTFVVPANSAVGIKWRFLSPFGGTAAVLRSSRNIAPSVNGVALPNASDQP